MNSLSKFTLLRPLSHLFRLRLLAVLTAVLVAGTFGAATAAVGAGKGLCWFNYSIENTPTAVFDIFRDSAGRNWIGTTSGLFSFNGYQAYPAMDGSRIFRAQIYAMAERDGVIYVGTNNGLFTLDPARSRISEIEGVESPREIRSLILVGNTLWIGSLNGLYHYRTDTSAISGPVTDTPHRAVYSLLESADGTIYIGTYNGLCAYNPATGVYSDVDLKQDSSASCGGNLFVNTMIEDTARGIIYIGTEGNLLAYVPTDGTARVIPGCEGNSVKSLAISGDILVVGTDNGLGLRYESDGRIEVFRHDSRTPYSLASNVVWSLLADKQGNIWAGTEVGVSIVNPDSPVRVFSLADITGMSAGQQVFNILRDSHGALWLGGTNGLIRLEGDYPYGASWFRPGSEKPLSHNRVRDIMETSAGQVWAATDGGINIYDERSHSFRNHRMANRDRSRNANWAYGILEDTADSTVWVAGYLGGIFCERLSRFVREDGTHFADTVLSPASGALVNDLIGQMTQDLSGNKWVLHFRDSALTRIEAGTRRVSRVPISAVTGEEPAMICPARTGGIWCGFYGGVARISADGTVCDTIVRFPFGAGDETIKAMAPVARELWVATGKAVWAVNPATMQARLLPLPSKTYSAIYYDVRRREAILGATDEIVLADPARILAEHVDESVAGMRITEAGRVSVIDFGSPKQGAFRLPSDNRNIEIDLSTATFSPSRYLRFCYSLDDEAPRLIEDGDNTISITTLPSGSHTLRVSVAGSSAAPRELRIEVARPWYRSHLALAIYALSFVAIVLMIIKEGHRRQRRHIEEMERTNVLATVENRLFFLANISHELKTPLAMIIGPLSKIRMGEPAEEAAKDIETAYRSAIKLNSLIHQTVEINRMDLRRDNMLIYSRIDVVEFCRDIFDSYRRSVEHRHFVFSSAMPHIYARIDAVKLESLLSNLLSNAVKYTSDGSTIALNVSAGDTDFEIAVSDDGVGIPAAEQGLVFQRLYRSPRTAGTHEGTGIGLYLVRQYAELLGGSVTVESRVDEGSTFRLRLPLGEDAEEPDSQSVAAEEAAGVVDKRKRVLIVDDNRSIASFISSVLSGTYNCAVAANGKAGLTVASSFRPDLIITDEMMPVMSGLEMSRRLKANPALAAVPILLLTAKDTPDIYGESVNSGVDAFMAKPFEAPVLLAKVAQLINKGEDMRRNMRFDALTAVEPDENTTAAEKQLAAVTDVIENNLSNPDLNVDFVCKTVGITSKTLYRLLKKYVGVSPVDYIRQTRLRKAAMLLEQKKFSVSEVMYMVGFSSSSYFSKCFAAMFGCTPGQYPDKTINQ